MCAYELQLPTPVNLVTFHRQPQRTNELAALTADGHFLVYGQGTGDQSEPAARLGGFRSITHAPQLKTTYRVLVDQEEPLALCLLLWLGCVPGDPRRPRAPSQPWRSSHVWRWKVTLSACVTSSKTGTVALQLEDGQIRKFLWDSLKPSVVEWQDSTGCSINFPDPCVQTALCTIEEVRVHICLGLRTDLTCLLATQRWPPTSPPSWSTMTSCCSPHTRTHAAASDSAHSPSKGCRWPWLQTEVRIRMTRIVTVVPQDTRLILQMPCGNLETIHHRALVLTQLRKCLDSQKAFECMRKLRINLNLIYDHNPKVFLESVETFLRQLDSINHINLFLTELKEEDTTTTMYPYPLNTTGQSAPGACGKKVDIVCDALHCTMESMDQHKYCLSILKSHVKKTVPELEVALQKVHELQVNPPSAANAVSAEEALKYLLFLVNVNELYEHTLGTYDVDLVLMVAEKSQ
ncbi:hypothetical protein J4Q44_G00305000 [Coregonus suidteri]|uniref:ELP1 alpha-solenoid domain-containing protein n=1 Tax=Coregonus suidteri TaxID=861788 RepID=A0AAN8L698_9TELE